MSEVHIKPTAFDIDSEKLNVMEWVVFDYNDSRYIVRKLENGGLEISERLTNYEFECLYYDASSTLGIKGK